MAEVISGKPVLIVSDHPNSISGLEVQGDRESMLAYSTNLGMFFKYVADEPEGTRWKLALNLQDVINAQADKNTTWQVNLGVYESDFISVYEENLAMNIGGTLSFQGGSNLNLSGGDANININSGEVRISSSNPGFPGATYQADYSSNYNNRSLVDKEYVDGVTERSYAVYTAIISQTGAAAPTAVVLEDEIGGISFSYDLAGVYNVNSAGADFTAGKTAVILSVGATQGYVVQERTGSALIQLTSFDTSWAASDGIIKECTLEIRVYS